MAVDTLLPHRFRFLNKVGSIFLFRFDASVTVCDWRRMHVLADSCRSFGKAHNNQNITWDNKLHSPVANT